jgi:PhnB protein
MDSEYGGIVPHLTVRDTDAAVRFYREAFGADELFRNSTPDGRVFHCELLVNGSRLLLHDDFSESGETPDKFGGSPVTLHLYVPDVDAVYARAVAHGARAVAEPADAFWGDRYAQLEDPSGHRWSIATRQDDISVETHQQRADQWSGAGEGGDG